MARWKVKIIKREVKEKSESLEPLLFVGIIKTISCTRFTFAKSQNEQN